MFLVQETVFAAAFRTNRNTFPKIIRDFRTQAGVSGEPGL
jgi:hypothetical protein